MILLGIGANLSSPSHGSPLATCKAAVEALNCENVAIVKCSGWYRTAPVPPSDQPWYVNGVAVVETPLSPGDLLTFLQGLEHRFGRVRTIRDAPRMLDLDLLAYGDLIRQERPILPHPRMRNRGFVLVPLGEVAPGWHHPVLGKTVEILIDELPVRALSGQVEPI